MAIETYAKEVENFAFHPIGAGPDWSHGIHCGILAGQLHAETHLVAPWNGNQVVAQLKARLERETVDAHDVGKEIEFQAGVVAAAFACAAYQIAGNNDGNLAPKFSNVLDCARVPLTQPLGDNITAEIQVIRHVFIPG